jgi:hypothetical protein
VETATVEKNDGEERQRTAVRFVNMEKHCTHKNVSSMERERERERERAGAPETDPVAKSAGETKRPAKERRGQSFQTERERERMCAPETEGAISQREREREKLRVGGEMKISFPPN